MNQNSYINATARIVRAVASNQSKAWLAVSAATLLAAGTASADLYISTIGNTVEYGLGISAEGRGGFTFTTDSNDYYLQGFSGTFLFSVDVDPLLDMRAALHTVGIGGQPSMMVPGVSFTNTPLADGQVTVQFTATSPVILSANTTYALIVGPTGSGSVTYTWRLTPESTGTHTDVPGSSWALPTEVWIQSGESPWIDGGGGTHRVIAGVYATPIPEPSTFALLGAAGVIGWHLRRRRH